MTESIEERYFLSRPGQFFSRNQTMTRYTTGRNYRLISISYMLNKMESRDLVPSGGITGKPGDKDSKARSKESRTILGTTRIIIVFQELKVKSQVRTGEKREIYSYRNQLEKMIEDILTTSPWRESCYKESTTPFWKDANCLNGKAVANGQPNTFNKVYLRTGENKHEE